MKLVSGRNRRNREIRKLLVSLALHVVIIKAKKTRSQLHSALTTCFHCTKHITPVTTRARLKIQTPIALIIPRLLNPVAAAGALSGPGLRTASKHVTAVCPRRSLRPRPSLLSARGQLPLCEPPAVPILSNNLFSCLCFHGYLQKGRERFVLWIRPKSRFLSRSCSRSRSL